MAQDEGILALFPYVDRIVQWVIIPMGIALWYHNKKHIEHEKGFIRFDGELEALKTMIDAWRIQRTEDMTRAHEAMEKLTHAVEKLNEKMDRILISQGGVK